MPQSRSTTLSKHQKEEDYEQIRTLQTPYMESQTGKEELQQRNRLGTVSRKLLCLRNTMFKTAMQKKKVREKSMECHNHKPQHFPDTKRKRKHTKKAREKSRECHNHKPQPFPDTKRKRKPTKPTKQAQIEQTYEKH